MRIAITFTLMILLCCQSSRADEKAREPVLSDSERSRVQAQIDELAKNKLKQGEVARKNIKEQALHQGKLIDQRLQQDKHRIDTAVEDLSGRYGSDVVNQIGNAKKRELEARANAQKSKVAADARADAARRQSSAKKSAEGVGQTVDGLKSQVSKKGKYGLKPHASNLYVRTYGKDK